MPSSSSLPPPETSTGRRSMSSIQEISGRILPSKPITKAQLRINSATTDSACTFFRVLCMHIRMHGCIYVCLSLFTYVCLYVCMYVNMHVCIWHYVCLNVCMHV